MGVQLSVQSNATGDRPVIDRSFLSAMHQSHTPRVCPYRIKCGKGQLGRCVSLKKARLGLSLPAHSPRQMADKRGPRGKTAQGPRDMTWHPEPSGQDGTRARWV
uniref:DUF1263 domain-containing protein n=1 Tax=Oryza barthii TaxID=65489 RepID=A0A0D3EN39_9ORYZ